MKKNETSFIKGYGKLWPRETFDLFDKQKLIISSFEGLKQTGVYILYRDEMPYYVGKASDSALYKRLHDHSNKTTDSYFYFWNYFSFFVIPNIELIAEIEGVLIASLPTANRAVKKLPAIQLPKQVANRLRENRRKKHNG